MVRIESIAVRWGAFAGITTFLLLIPLAVTNNNQVVWGLIGAVAGAGIVVTLIGKWWERGWNIKIADAEARRVDIERERVNIEREKLGIEKIRLIAELCERGVISKDFAKNIFIS